MNKVFIMPAYGRKYKSLEAMRLDWEDGKDFKIVSGPYCSRRDLKALKAQFSNVTVTDGWKEFIV